jgi:hypothetical protein
MTIIYKLASGPALGLGHECDGLGPNLERGGPNFCVYKYIFLSPMSQLGLASM